MSESQAKEPSQQTSETRRIREIQKRDLMVVRYLISDYPGFSNLNGEQKLDRIVLVLESICGFGAVSQQTIDQLQSVINIGIPSVETYFKTSTYQSSSSEQQKNKYRESFEGAFCLEREFKKNLSEEGGESSSEQPIRKKVAGKKRLEAPTLNTRPLTSLRNTENSPKARNNVKDTSEVRPQKSAVKSQANHNKKSSVSDDSLNKMQGLSTQNVEKPGASMKKTSVPLMVIGAVAVLLSLVAIVFAIAS